MDRQHDKPGKKFELKTVYPQRSDILFEDDKIDYRKEASDNC